VQQRLGGLDVPGGDAGEAERVDVAVGDGAGERVGVLLAERRDDDESPSL
jgi:hypothetical protein